MKIRSSESNNLPKLVEYLQGKILVRFDFIEKVKDNQTFFTYKEFVFETNKTIQEIEAICLQNGHVLTQDYKNLII